MIIRPEILHTRRFNERFMECASRYFVSLRVAVPYIGKIPGFNSIVGLSKFAFSRGCKQFQIVTLPPGSKSTILRAHADLIISQGANLMIRNHLHSKIYQFTFREGDQAAFVGSANLTRGGFETNDETVAFFRDKCDNDAVTGELRRIEGPGAFPFEYWKATAKHRTNHADIV